MIFPDFGLPFDLHPPLVAAIVGYHRTPEQIEAANRAYNRLLVDFCSTASDRLAGLAVLSFADPEATVTEIRWAKEAGLKGIVLPAMDEDAPVFDQRFEPGTGWVVSALRGMDYSWQQSYMRRDVREIVKHTPSFYYERQVHMGSSLFSRAEVAAREAIGVDKILIGADYPHHEGTWGAGPGTTEYLQATLGALGVPASDARQMLGENAIDVFHFDRAALRKVADEIGTDIGRILTPPTEEYFPRGDVHKPLATAF